jgi:addiction module HigA family antidote
LAGCPKGQRHLHPSPIFRKGLFRQHADIPRLGETLRVEPRPAVDMNEKLKPVSLGEVLAEEFLKSLGMSNYRLAKEIDVPAQGIGEIMAGRRAITADTELRLCRFFGLSDGWWLRLQADFNTEVAKASLAKTLAKIRPWKEVAKQTADAH